MSARVFAKYAVLWGTALWFLSAATPAQVSSNVRLHATLQPASPGTAYSDIWGYRDPATGREYALLSSIEGTHVIDCTNPAAPALQATVPPVAPGPLNLWRDIKTLGSYAYVVSEAHGGIQIIDLADPSAPRDLGAWGTERWRVGHNLAIDEGTGYAYVCFTNTGLHVLDVGTDPENPTYLYNLATPVIHDLVARDGIGYFADLVGSSLRIYDVAQLPVAMPLLGSTGLPGARGGHNAWPTRDGNYCVTTNEVAGGPIGIFDVSNKRLPFLIATYQANPVTSPSAIPHNAYVDDRVLHLAYYTEGYRVLDLSNPSSPVEVGFYDTHPDPVTNPYAGAWGCYHRMPSGVVYVSDQDRGLYVLEPRATAVRYGAASSGSAGTLPEIHAFGAAYLGNATFGVEVERAPAGRPGVLLLGAGRSSATVGGVTIHVRLGSPQPLVLPVTASVTGAAAVRVPVPVDPALDGAVLNAQFLFADSAAGLDLSASGGLEFELFPAR